MFRSVATLAVLLSSFLLHAQQPESKPPELPKHAVIHNEKWILLHVQSLSDGDVGRTNCYTKTILIVTGLNANDEVDTIWHELLHAFSDCDNTKFNNSDDPADGCEGHCGIGNLAKALTDFTRDNPELISYLTHRAGNQRNQ